MKIPSATTQKWVDQLDSMQRKSQADKATEFLRLHSGPGILVLANVWDVAGARLLERLGFTAVATSSAAIANSLGYPDGERISRADMLQVAERIAKAVAVPVTADLEAGYGDGLEAMAETARMLVNAGAVGLNLEDRTNDPRNPLADLSRQVVKIRRVREVASAMGVPLVLNARTDVYLAEVGDPASRFDRAVERLNAYRQAGADSLFVPGVRDGETIAQLVHAVRGPLNILAGPGTPSIPELARLGVARVSFGSWPMRACMGLFARFARELKDRGTFQSALADAIPYADLNELFVRT